jgi:hypothetical protein
VLFLVWRNLDFSQKEDVMTQIGEFSIRITNGWPHFVMRARLGKGRLVGTLTARGWSDPARVYLKRITARSLFGDRLRQTLLEHFERAARLSKRSLILVECAENEKLFFELNGFRVIANSNSHYQMEKQL